MAGCDPVLDEKIKLVAVVGPTAAGKTAVAVSLAEQFGGEVISCDSMQIYKGMPIASAVPDETEKRGIPHHLMEIADPGESFSVARYCELAHKAVADVAARGNLPILCGGTGLYYTSLVDDVRFGDESGDPELRSKLAVRAQAEGNAALHAELTEIDPDSAAKISPNDQKRIIRALELCISTGMTAEVRERQSRAGGSRYDVLPIGIGYRSRETLYDRINRRVDVMLEKGLVEEARAFFSLGSAGTAAQAIGHKELAGYLDGRESLESAADRLRQSTRRYAKRQLTWFRRDERIKWIYADDYSDYDGVVNAAAGIIREKGYGCRENTGK